MTRVYKSSEVEEKQKLYLNVTADWEKSALSNVEEKQKLYLNDCVAELVICVISSWRETKVVFK